MMPFPIFDEDEWWHLCFAIPCDLLSEWWQVAQTKGLEKVDHTKPTNQLNSQDCMNTSSLEPSNQFLGGGLGFSVTTLTTLHHSLSPQYQVQCNKYTRITETTTLPRTSTNDPKYLNLSMTSITPPSNSNGPGHYQFNQFKLLVLGIRPSSPATSSKQTRTASSGNEHSDNWFSNRLSK